MPDVVSLSEDRDLFGATIASAPVVNRDLLAESLRQQLKSMSLSEFVSLITNTYIETIEYAELCGGGDTCQRTSLLFNPHRLSTQAADNQFSVFSALQSGGYVSGLARASIDRMAKGAEGARILYRAIELSVNGVQYVAEFPPYIARDLATEHGVMASSRILDPCGGWGGRMIGFSAVCDNYECFEPSTRTAHGLESLRSWLQKFRSAFSAVVHNAPFEDSDLQESSYDFALTSPPYYDTERYSEEPTNSFNRYPTFQKWVSGFFEPLIHLTMRALKPGAPFLLNIGSRKYPLNTKLARICDGKYSLENIGMRHSGASGLGKTGEGETFYRIIKLGDANV